MHFTQYSEKQRQLDNGMLSTNGTQEIFFFKNDI